jgi:hypothetical protein
LGSLQRMEVNDLSNKRGCNMEYGYAKAKGMPIKFIG